MPALMQTYSAAQSSKQLLQVAGKSGDIIAALRTRSEFACGQYKVIDASYGLSKAFRHRLSPPYIFKPAAVSSRGETKLLFLYFNGDMTSAEPRQVQNDHYSAIQHGK